MPLTPLFAEGRPIAEPAMTSRVYGGSRPLVAYAGGRLLTIWEESRDRLGGGIRGTISNAAGFRLSPQSFTLREGYTDGNLYLVGARESFALFTVDRQGGTSLMDIDREGRVLRDRQLSLPPIANARFAWNGTHFLVASVAPGGAREVITLNRDGDVVAHRAAPAPVAAIGSAGNAFVLAETGSSGLSIHFAEATGTTSANLDPSPTRTAVVAQGSGDESTLVTWVSLGESGALKAAIVGPSTVSRIEILAHNQDFTSPIAAGRVSDGYIIVTMTTPPGPPPARFEAWRLSTEGSLIGGPVSISAPGTPNSSAATEERLVFATTKADDGIAHLVVDRTLGSRVVRNISYSPAFQRQPLLEAGAGGVLAAWNEMRDVPIVRTAKLTGGETHTRSTLGKAAPFPVAIAWNGSEFLLLHHDYQTLFASRLEADGSPIGLPIEIADAPAAAPSVIWSGDRWTVAWVANGIHLRTISPGGIASPVRHLLITPQRLPERSFSITAVDLGFDGEDLLLAWSEMEDIICVFCDFPDRMTFATRVNADGDEIAHGRLALGRGSDSLSAASSGAGRFAVTSGGVAWILDLRANVRTVTARRTLLDWRSSSDVIWDGSNYVIAVRYAAKSDSLIAVHRIDAAGQVVARPRGTGTLDAETPHGRVSVASSSGNILVALEEGTFSSGSRAVTYSEAEMTPLPDLPGPPSNVRLRLVGEDRVELSWDPPVSGGPVTFYILELFDPDFGWQGPGILPADSRARIIYAGQPVRVRAFNAAGLSPLTSRQRAIR